MATELEAKKARDLHFDLLTKSGAHALAIDAIKGPKKKSFAIIAFTEGKNELPENVEITIGEKTTNVPIIIEQSTRFKPE